jgi:hypothetical protein
VIWQPLWSVHETSVPLIDTASAGGKFHLPPAKSGMPDFGSCDDLPATYIIVPVLNKKPSRKRHSSGRPAEG